jgi:molybdate transport system substrate-binding protein
VKKIILLTFIATTLLQAQTITVALAANVSYAIKSLETAFKQQHPKTDLRIIIGGSGKLTAQIKNGAPYDIFMAANMRYPQALYNEKMAITAPKIYAKGSLAILSKKERDFSQGIAIVTDKSIHRIALANPKSAPYGKAALEALKNAKLYDKVRKKAIYGESIAQALSYTIRAADLGFIAKSALYSPKLQHFKEGKNWIEVNPKLYHAIDQGVVILKYADKNKAAKEFYLFLFSPKAKAIFKKYGYNF